MEVTLFRKRNDSYPVQICCTSVINHPSFLNVSWVSRKMKKKLILPSSIRHSFATVYRAGRRTVVWKDIAPSDLWRFTTCAKRNWRLFGESLLLGDYYWCGSVHSVIQILSAPPAVTWIDERGHSLNLELKLQRRGKEEEEGEENVFQTSLLPPSAWIKVPFIIWNLTISTVFGWGRVEVLSVGWSWTTWTCLEPDSIPCWLMPEDQSEIARTRSENGRAAVGVPAFPFDFPRVSRDCDKNKTWEILHRGRASFFVFIFS